jgi:hypothetical protein
MVRGLCEGKTMTEFIFGKASIRLVCSFTCDRCHTKEKGDTIAIEVGRFESLAELVGAIAKEPQRAANMPIGWASYYGSKRTLFYCGVCSAKHEAESAEKRRAENAARIAAGLAPNHY